MRRDRQATCRSRRRLHLLFRLRLSVRLGCRRKRMGAEDPQYLRLAARHDREHASDDGLCRRPRTSCAKRAPTTNKLNYTPLTGVSPERPKPLDTKGIAALQAELEGAGAKNETKAKGPAAPQSRSAPGPARRRAVSGRSIGRRCTSRQWTSGTIGWESLRASRCCGYRFKQSRRKHDEGGGQPDPARPADPLPAARPRQARPQHPADARAPGRIGRGVPAAPQDRQEHRCGASRDGRS